MYQCPDIIPNIFHITDPLGTPYVRVAVIEEYKQIRVAFGH